MIRSVKVLMVDESRFNCLRVARIMSAEEDIAFRYVTEPERALIMADEFLPTVIICTHAADNEGFSSILEMFRENSSTADVPLIMLVDDEVSLADPDKVEETGECLCTGWTEQDIIEKTRRLSTQFLNTRQEQIQKQVDSDMETGPARVLLVDDSNVVCKLIEQKIMHDEHITFKYCTDSSLAFEMAKQFCPTVILLDLEMPGKNGFDLLREFRDDLVLTNVPVIVLSGISDSETKDRVFRSGANDYAEKQMDTAELTSRIHYHSKAYMNALKLNESIHEIMEAKKRLEVQRDFIRKTFGRYLSDEIVANILETPEGLELGGEKRVISIMMADLRGFTSLSERLPPETVLSIINNYLRVMTDVLFRYNATIDEFIGDAILAVFGAPVVRPDDIQRAVACAVEMQLSMEKVNSWNREQGYPDIAMGIGLNTGEVIVGNIGSERRAKYGIVGQHVNLTGRIESYTVKGQILASRSTVEACGDNLRIDGQMDVVPKGMNEPITIYDIGGIGGRYNLYLPETKDLKLIPLSEPIKARIAVLEGKHESDERYEAEVTGLLNEAAEIKGGFKVKKLSDIRISLFDSSGGCVTNDLYAKVTEAGRGRSAKYRIRFTSIPPEAEDYLVRLQALAASKEGR